MPIYNQRPLTVTWCSDSFSVFPTSLKSPSNAVRGMSSNVRIKRVHDSWKTIEVDVNVRALMRYVYGGFDSGLLRRPGHSPTLGRDAPSGLVRRDTRDLLLDVIWTEEDDQGEYSPSKATETGMTEVIDVPMIPSTNLSEFAGKWVAIGPRGVVAANEKFADLLDYLRSHEISDITTEYVDPDAGSSLRVGSG